MFLQIDLSKNLQYDRLTHLILKKVIQKDSNCIDVGCHKGEILNDFIHFAPKGKHFAFEPIPYMFENLEKKFEGKAKIFPFALSNEKGESTFQVVKNAPAYSGLKNRRYSDIKNPEIEQIKVELNKLDDIISEEIKIDLIKIDIEGAELACLRGAYKCLQRFKPKIIVEIQDFSAARAGYKSIDILDFLSAIGYIFHHIVSIDFCTLIAGSVAHYTSI